MYSKEIEEYIKIKNNLLTIKEYTDIVKYSPQIDHVKYDGENFNMWTTDNYKFTFKIKFRKE